ncbi:MAG: hypothetical protein H6595_03975 [Flavobacteriales bacterium]|nr:hypothetical protein [Flavobacteriales bacterium]MCB9166617.1 hypothetical protein [Flavobacteriales bacterium]
MARSTVIPSAPRPMHGLGTLLLVTLLLPACSVHKFVAATHPNGKPEVIVFMKGAGEDAEKVMEKVYYPNGQMEYVGHFANGVEDGEWTYYYENGTKKYVEHWENGLEHGIQLDYAPDGQVQRELHYDHGNLVKEIDRSHMP